MNRQQRGVGAALDGGSDSRGVLDSVSVRGIGRGGKSKAFRTSDRGSLLDSNRNALNILSPVNGDSKGGLNHGDGEGERNLGSACSKMDGDGDGSFKGNSEDLDVVLEENVSHRIHPESVGSEKKTDAMNNDAGVDGNSVFVFSSRRNITRQEKLFLGFPPNMSFYGTKGISKAHARMKKESEMIRTSSGAQQKSSDVRREFGIPSPYTNNFNQSRFAFAASLCLKDPLSPSSSIQKNKSIPGENSNESHCAISKENLQLPSTQKKLIPPFNISTQIDETKKEAQHVPFVSQIEERISDNKREAGAELSSIPDAAASVAAQETCERCRLRGNRAYANGYLAKAEEFYTRGVDSVSPYEQSRSCLRSLMLCYGNRAVAHISLGRVREALNDCMRALAIDPSFIKIQIRAANCHLSLGEAEDASRLFTRCLQTTGNDFSLDKKNLEEASEGLEKAQKVRNIINQSMELFLKDNSSIVANALEILSEVLLISPHSESLIKMKAEVLFMLKSYEDVIKLCEETMDSAERNSALIFGDGEINDGLPECTHYPLPKIWRVHLIAKSYFYLGRIDEALDLIQRHEKMGSISQKFESRCIGSLDSFYVTLKELSCLKASGNDAYQAGQYSEAVECYTAALACTIESRPFAALCFCNRAAAYQSLGQITEAIADCSLAIAFNANYMKAIYRRSTLSEMIRDYGQAISDLNRLILLLESQTEVKSNLFGSYAKPTDSKNDLKHAHLRLTIVEEAITSGIPLRTYMILGVEPSTSSVDIKKAYRKAALRHHPDKVAQFLARRESNDDAYWRELADVAYQDADRLFKMIGESYAVLSDPTKRMRYDTEEKTRTNVKPGNSNAHSRRSESFCGN